MTSPKNRLLAVDDNPDNLDLLSRRLERRGYEVARAANGRQALDMLDAGDFDLVLLDIMMPDINGLDVLQTIRQTHAMTRLPVIMATAIHESETHVEALKRGANDFITKPYDFPVILARVQTHLSLKRAEEALRASRDTLEEKVAERTLELSLVNERLETLVEQLPCGVVLLDEYNQVALSNRIARNDFTALAGDTAALTRLGEHPIGHVLSKSRRAPLEITCGGSEQRIFQVQSTPFRQGGHVLITRDITIERQVQERVQKHDHLAAVGQLAAGIAHDFNNLLTVMMGVPQILSLRDDLPEDLKAELDNIYDQGKRASLLVRQVLDFSRAQKTEHQPIDLAPFLKESMKLLERTFPTHIHIQIDCTSCLVDANPTQLQQVLTNLAVNARDAMPEGGKLRIGLAPLHIPEDGAPPLPEMPTGDWAVLTVSDTGTGIPPDVLKRIFEPFFTTKERGRGTGLGLAQVYGIIQQHKGFIDVASQPGAGTTFIIYLPLTIGTVPDEVPAPSPMPRGQGQTILVVEDKPAVRQVVTGLLSVLNYRVEAVGDGQAARSRCVQQGNIDLILADYMLPDTTGDKLFAELRQINPGIRFILMTGSSTNDGGAIPVPEGIAGVLEKPLVLREVAEVIHRSFE